MNTTSRFDSIFDKPIVSFKKNLAKHRVPSDIKTAIYNDFPCAYPNYFAQAIKTFVPLGLLSSEHAMDNLQHIKQYAELWFTEDDTADLKAMLATLQRDNFGQTEFSRLVQVTKKLNEQCKVPHDVRFYLAFKLDELLDQFKPMTRN